MSDGLECFVHDDEHTVGRYVRAVAIEGRLQGCFWAAVRDDAARQVQQQMASGQRLQALQTLDAVAVEIIRLDSRTEYRDAALCTT